VPVKRSLRREKERGEKMKAICDIWIGEPSPNGYGVTGIFCEGATFVAIVSEAVKQAQCILGPLDREPQITLSISVNIREV
jgi:hypothetical protein